MASVTCCGDFGVQKMCHHGQNCPKGISFLHVIYNWNSFYLSEQAPTWGSENLNLRLDPDENEEVTYPV